MAILEHEERGLMRVEQAAASSDLMVTKVVKKITAAMNEHI